MPTETVTDTPFPCLAVVLVSQIMGNDLTNISQEALDILRNEEVIAVNQAIAAKGWRESPRGASEVWVRELEGWGPSTSSADFVMPTNFLSKSVYTC